MATATTQVVQGNLDARKRRAGSLGSDDEESSNSKYGRLEHSEDNMADKERFARENHCEIERRRRNKMTALHCRIKRYGAHLFCSCKET
ncbi:UNVERIFIED_CONTAM: hypothetical protein RMT77_010058 [Armadillidium vulgare]